MALLQKSSKERPKPGSTSSGDPGGACTPCDNYRVDVLAVKFGTCKCGFLKSEHAASAFAKSAAPTSAAKRGGVDGAPECGSRTRDLANKLGKRISGRFPGGFQIPGMKKQHAPSSSGAEEDESQVETPDTAGIAAGNKKESGSDEGKRAHHRHHRRCYHQCKKQGAFGGFRLPGMRAGVNDAIGATKEEKMVSSATESVGRTRMLAAKLGKTLSGRFDPIGGQEAVAPLPHAKAPSNQSSSSAARIEVEVDDSRTSNSSSLDNSALLSRPVIRRGRRRGHTAAAAQARKNGMIKIKSFVRLSMRKSRTESATRKISDAETPPQASPVAKKANEKEVDIVEGKLDVTASPSHAAIHASVEKVIDASKDGIDSPRASSPVRHDSSDSLEFDDSSDVDGEKGEAMDAVSECSHIDLGEDDKSKAGEMMSVGEDDVEADKKVTGKKDEPNESEEGNKIEDDDDEDGAGEEAKLDEVPSSDVFDEAKHVVPKESEVEFLELNIEFKSGTLGFTFSRGAGDQASAIVVTKVKEGTQAFGKVAVGDIILKIGDASVADGAESAKIVADLIKKTPRPVTLTFKRSLKHLLTKIDPRVVSVSRESIRLKDAHVLDLFKGGDAPREVGEYDIEYTKDNVGFDADSSPLGLRVSVSSKKLSKKMAALEQRGGVGRVFAGDYVLSVANVPAIALPKARYSKIVDEAPRPLKMRFRRAIYHELKLPSFEVTIGGAMSLGGEVLQSKNFQGVMIITNLSMAGAPMMSGLCARATGW